MDPGVPLPYYGGGVAPQVYDPQAVVGEYKSECKSFGDDLSYTHTSYQLAPDRKTFRCTKNQCCKYAMSVIGICLPAALAIIAYLGGFGKKTLPSAIGSHIVLGSGIGVSGVLAAIGAKQSGSSSCGKRLESVEAYSPPDDDLDGYDDEL